MQSKQTEALKQALTELFWYEEAGLGRISSCDAIHALREALADQPAQPQQEPVCYKHGEEPKRGCAWCDKQPAQQRHISYVCPQCYWSLDEQPAKQQEPVATKLETQQFNCFHVSAEDFSKLAALPVGTKLYTSPPAHRTWVGLTDEEIDRMTQGNNYPGTVQGARRFARAIEAAHGIKE